MYKGKIYLQYLWCYCRLLKTYFEFWFFAVKFISKLKPYESHYGRAKSGPLYFSPLLSIGRIWIQWRKEYFKADFNNFSYTWKRCHEIFVHNFNIGFSMSRIATCSICEKYKNESRISEKVEELKLQLALHLQRGKQFHNVRKYKAKKGLLR